MKFLYSWIKEYAPTTLSAAQAAELLTRKSFEVESVEKIKGQDALLYIDILPNRSHDALSHLGVARELAAVSGQGVSKIKSPQYPFKESRKKTSEVLEVEVRTEACRRYCARVIRGVKVGPSPRWLQERLENLGINSINNLVDATNYVMLAMGQPLHVFDWEKLSGTSSGKKKIVVRLAQKNEKITTLDEKEYTLNDQTVVIADAKSAQAIAGIKGGSVAGISAQTKDIVIESANFEAAFIRRASRALNLRTDASVRFEADIDPALTNLALEVVTGLIQKLAGGEVLSGQVVSGHWKDRKNLVSASVEMIQRLIGEEISEKEIIRLLQNIGCNVQKVNLEKILHKTVTSLAGKPYKYGASATREAPNAFDCSSLTLYVFRALGIEIPRISKYQRFAGASVKQEDLEVGDLVFRRGKTEDFGHVGIYVGGGKITHADQVQGKVITETIKKFFQNGKLKWQGATRVIKDNEVLLITIPHWRRDIVLPQDVVEEVLRLWGLDRVSEKMPLAVLQPAEQDEVRLWLDEAENILADSGFYEVKNYSFIGEREKALLAEGALIELANPVSPEIKYLRPTLFFGLLQNISINYLLEKRVVLFEQGKIFSYSDRGMAAERLFLGSALFLNKSASSADVFYELKGSLENIMDKLGIDDFWLDDADVHPVVGDVLWHPVRRAWVKIGDEVIGVAGEANPLVLKQYDIPQRVALFEMDFEKVATLASAEREYGPIPKFPSAIRDIAVAVGKDEKIDTVQELIEDVGGSLLLDSDLFDIYEGENMEPGKKSLAFHLIFQSAEKTLTDTEVDGMVRRIITALEKNGWEVRKD